jgi:hypothetical protein
MLDQGDPRSHEQTVGAVTTGHNPTAASVTVTRTSEAIEVPEAP